MTIYIYETNSISYKIIQEVIKEINIMIKINNAEILNNNLKTSLSVNKNIKCNHYRYCIKTDDQKTLLVKLFKEIKKEKRG